MKTQVKAKNVFGNIVIIELNQETNKWKYEHSDKEFDEVGSLLKEFDLTIVPFKYGKEIDAYIVEKILQRFPMLAVGWNPCPEMAVINSANRPFEPALRFCLDHDDYFPQIDE